MSRGSKGKRVDRKGVRGGMFFVLFFLYSTKFYLQKTTSDHHNGGMNGHHQCDDEHEYMTTHSEGSTKERQGLDTR